MIAVGTVGNTRSRVPVDSGASFQAVFGDVVVEVAVNKTSIGLWIGSDRIGFRIGSDWNLRFWCRIIILREAVLTMTKVDRIFSSEPPVSLTKKIVFHVLPGLKFTIRLKIIGKMV